MYAIRIELYWRLQDALMEEADRLYRVRGWFQRWRAQRRLARINRLIHRIDIRINQIRVRQQYGRRLR